MSYKRISVFVAVAIVGLVFFSSLIKHKTKELFEQSIIAVDGGVLKYHHLTVSPFKRFPQLYVEVSGLAVEQAKTFNYEVDTLRGAISYSTVFQRELHISTLQLIRPNISISQRKKNNSEGDRVAVVSDDTDTPNNLEFSFPDYWVFDDLLIKDGAVHYQFGDSAYWAMHKLNCSVQGCFDDTSIATDLSAIFDYNTRDLALEQIPFGVAADLVLRNDQVQIKQGVFDLAHIVHQLSGQVLLRSHPQFDINFSSEQAPLESILALLPFVSLQDSNLLVDGALQSHGFIRGEYQGANAWPRMELHMKSVDASIAYQQQASRIEQIYLSALLLHPEGTSLDATTLALDSLHLQSNSNYIKGQVKMHHLVSSPYINAQLNGNVDLADIVEIFPVRSRVLKGKVTADVNMAGELADITNENYQAFVADGQVKLQGICVENQRFPKGLTINSAAFDFSPKSIFLRSFIGYHGKSELNLQGSFYNYISYLFDDQDLNGKLVLRSKYLNLNEFRSVEDKTSHQNSKGDKVHESSPFMVPNGLNLILETDIKTVHADDAIFRQCKGKMAIKGERLLLENLSLNSYGGTVVLTGSYDTQNLHKITSNLHILAKDVKLDEAASSISLLQQSVPLSQIAKGKVNSQMSYYGEMDERGTLNLNTLKATGNITSRGLHFSDHPSLYQLANQMKDPRYKSFTTSPFSIDFTMEKGQLNIAPFEVGIVEKKINAEGWYRVDNTLNFKIKTTVKAKEIGGDVSKYVAMLSDANKPLPVTLILTGDAAKPNVKYDTREALDILRKDVTKNLNNDVVKSVIRGFFK